MHVLELFDSGHDTYDIAKQLGMTEAAVWKVLHIQRSKRLRRAPEFGRPVKIYRKHMQRKRSL